ncbi:MAG TPA: HDIG domain-containing protein, partial [Gemmatimonadota bacterium]|nr:HDIG domain-containing protein [Gemmatimonadota bacterium]
RLLLVALVAGFTLVLFPPAGGYDVPVVRVGAVASEDLLAPFDYPVRRDEQELARLREQAAASVPPVYAVRPAAADTALAAIEVFLGRFAGTPAESMPARLPELARVDGRAVDLRASELRALADPEVRDRVLEFAGRVLPAVYGESWLLDAREATSIVGTQLEIRSPDGPAVIVSRDDLTFLEPGADVPSLARHAERLDPEIRRLVLDLLPALMAPSLEARPSLTTARRDEARRSVSPYAGEVLRGELIVAAHTRVTPEQVEKVASLRQELDRRHAGFSGDDLRAGLGGFAVGVAILLLYGFYLFQYRRDVFDDYRALAVLAAVWALVIGLAAFAERVETMPDFAAPVALGSILVAILWDARLSVATTLFLSVLIVAQVELGFPVLWTGLLGGLAGAWSVRRIRRRTQFYESLLFIIVGHTIALGALALVHLWTPLDLAVGLAWGALSAALSVFIAMGLLPILEWASGRTTDLTLLELADLNRPILKQLLVEAPGTFHHSVVVGNLAEAAAEGIGSNSLLARVGAYYHDIGKIRRPEYFVENQRDGVNPHQSLRPAASARIVSRHVSEGVVMARAAGLPESVVDFIREHHGTTRLSYFWHQAEREGRIEPATLGDFVYPGPRPRTKETAVVMLADSVEAASRVVRDPSPERFEEVVRRIVELKLEEHQLDDADLTFRDLATVQEKFIGVLCGMHHQRLDYPSVSLHAPEVQDHTGADPRSVPSVGRAPG